MKASYTVSEQTARAGASLLSGAAGGGTGSISASKAFSERREALFHPRDFALLGNCQAIVMPYDGTRSLDARRCYLKPDFCGGIGRTRAPARPENSDGSWVSPISSRFFPVSTRRWTTPRCPR